MAMMIIAIVAVPHLASLAKVAVEIKAVELNGYFDFTINVKYFFFGYLSAY
jgi:hypothetical protein|tara:strand:- start:472 stop:624 length:153 start_codon:yes stop_codon:yes gene_type:complete